MAILIKSICPQTEKFAPHLDATNRFFSNPILRRFHLLSIGGFHRPVQSINSTHPWLQLHDHRIFDD
jgi:hypothetical protein